MTDFGLTPQGFVAKRLADCFADAQADFRAAFGADIDVTAKGPYGQFIGLQAERMAALWEILDELYRAGIVNGASGVPFDQLLVLNNILRLPAKPTTVDVLALGSNGTVIRAGQIMKDGVTGVLYSSTNDAVIAPGVPCILHFEAQVTGPQQCLAGNLSIIQTPVSGWSSGSNTADGVLGRNVETEAGMLARRRKAAITVVSSSNPGVLSAVLRVPDVTEVREIENASSAPDADGRPAHSYELVVRGGDSAAILAAMFRTKPSGIATSGTTPGTVVDLRGDGQPMAFSRPIAAKLWIDVRLTVNARFPLDGITQVRNAILTYGQTQIQTGEDAAPFKIEQGIETPGIEIFELRIGRSAAPTASDPVFVASTELATFDSLRLNVNVVGRI